MRWFWQGTPVEPGQVRAEGTATYRVIRGHQEHGFSWLVEYNDSPWFDRRLMSDKELRAMRIING